MHDGRQSACHESAAVLTHVARARAQRPEREARATGICTLQRVIATSGGGSRTPKSVVPSSGGAFDHRDLGSRDARVFMCYS